VPPEFVFVKRRMAVETPRRLEDAAWEGDDGVELLLLDEDLPERPVGGARPEEDAVGDDDGGAAPGLEEPEEEGEEEELGLLRPDDLLEVFRGVLVVEGAGERGIREDEGVALLLARVVLRQRVAVADGGALHAVEEHVHAPDPEHRVVEVEAVEGGLVEVLLKLRVAEELGMPLAEVLARGDEEAGGAAGRVADDVLRGGSSRQ
jgi:hypothetical protein